MLNRRQLLDTGIPLCIGNFVSVPRLDVVIILVRHNILHSMIVYSSYNPVSIFLVVVTLIA